MEANQEVKRNPSNEERIILNVGGIKYETYRSTLTSRPDTFLGAMFHERNDALLKKSGNQKNGGNEYFFDRNGYAFRYILEYYRTGKILWMDDNYGHLYQPNINIDKSPNYCIIHPTITRAELAQELDFFQIPTSNYPHLSLHDQPVHPASKTINTFISTFERLAHEILANLETKIEIIFPWRDRSKFSALPDLDVVTRLLAPFAEVTGYNILEEFGQEIGQVLKKRVPGLVWNFSEREASENYPPRFWVMIEIKRKEYRNEIKIGSWLVELDQDDSDHETFPS